MMKALALVFIGYYLGKRGLPTDQDVQKLISTNKDILDSLQKQGVI